MGGGGGMTSTELAVELWSARAEYREGSVEDIPVRTARAAHPPVRLCTAHADGDVLVVGRHGVDLDDDHLPWTDGDGADDDLQLSRTQLRFTRHDHGWRVHVPGPAQSKRRVTVRYWASGRALDLWAGGSGVTLDPAAHVSLCVVTPRRCYWALVATPPEPRTEISGLLPSAGRVGTVAYDDVVEGRPPSFPRRWREAIRVKFRPYLTWPMDLVPGPVEPRHYADPAMAAPEDSARFQRWVKRTVLDTQAAAVARGFEPREPSAIDVRLVEWLVARGDLTHEHDRASWPEPARQRNDGGSSGRSQASATSATAS
jgi:hypothetical protein